MTLFQQQMGNMIMLNQALMVLYSKEVLYSRLRGSNGLILHLFSMKYNVNLSDLSMYVNLDICRRAREPTLL